MGSKSVPLPNTLWFLPPKDGDLRGQCVTRYMVWHHIDQPSSKYNTVLVCGSARAVVPVGRATLALETTASGVGLSLMLCRLPTSSNHTQ